MTCVNDYSSAVDRYCWFSGVPRRRGGGGGGVVGAYVISAHIDLGESKEFITIGGCLNDFFES